MADAINVTFEDGVITVTGGSDTNRSTPASISDALAAISIEAALTFFVFDNFVSFSATVILAGFYADENYTYNNAASLPNARIIPVGGCNWRSDGNLLGASGRGFQMVLRQDYPVGSEDQILIDDANADFPGTPTLLWRNTSMEFVGPSSINYLFRNISPASYIDGFSLRNSNLPTIPDSSQSRIQFSIFTTPEQPYRFITNNMPVNFSLDTSVSDFNISATRFLTVDGVVETGSVEVGLRGAIAAVSLGEVVINVDDETTNSINFGFLGDTSQSSISIANALFNFGIIRINGPNIVSLGRDLTFNLLICPSSELLDNPTGAGFQVLEDLEGFEVVLMDSDGTQVVAPVTSEPSGTININHPDIWVGFGADSPGEDPEAGRDSRFGGTSPQFTLPPAIITTRFESNLIVRKFGYDFVDESLESVDTILEPVSILIRPDQFMLMQSRSAEFGLSSLRILGNAILPTIAVRRPETGQPEFVFTNTGNDTENFNDYYYALNIFYSMEENISFPFTWSYEENAGTISTITASGLPFAGSDPVNLTSAISSFSSFTNSSTDLVIINQQIIIDQNVVLRLSGDLTLGPDVGNPAGFYSYVDADATEGSNRVSTYNLALAEQSERILDNYIFYITSRNTDFIAGPFELGEDIENPFIEIAEGDTHDVRYCFGRSQISTFQINFNFNPQRVVFCLDEDLLIPGFVNLSEEPTFVGNFSVTSSDGITSFTFEDSGVITLRQIAARIQLEVQENLGNYPVHPFDFRDNVLSFIGGFTIRTRGTTAIIDPASTIDIALGGVPDLGGQPDNVSITAANLRRLMVTYTPIETFPVDRFSWIVRDMATRNLVPQSPPTQNGNILDLGVISEIVDIAIFAKIDRYIVHRLDLNFSRISTTLTVTDLRPQLNVDHSVNYTSFLLNVSLVRTSAGGSSSPDQTLTFTFTSTTDIVYDTATMNGILFTLESSDDYLIFAASQNLAEPIQITSTGIILNSPNIRFVLPETSTAQISTETNIRYANFIDPSTPEFNPLNNAEEPNRFMVSPIRPSDYAEAMREIVDEREIIKFATFIQTKDS